MDSAEDPALHEPGSGASHILSWFETWFAGDDYTRAATRTVLSEVRSAAADNCLRAFA